MRVGKYNSAGIFIQQTVNLGVSRAGTLGLFTNGVLVHPLTEDQAARFGDDRAALKAYVELQGFALREENNDE